MEQEGVREREWDRRDDGRWRTRAPFVRSSVFVVFVCREEIKKKRKRKIQPTT